jgi:hypothetical protein
MFHRAEESDGGIEGRPREPNIGIRTREALLQKGRPPLTSAGPGA